MTSSRVRRIIHQRNPAIPRWTQRQAVPPSPTEAADRLGDPAPRDAAALMDEAEACLQAGRVDEAVQAALAASALQVQPERALPLLARAFEAQADFAGALEVYGRAIALENAGPEISGDMGKLALRLRKYDIAERVLAAHLQLGAPTPEAIAGLAQAQIGLRAFDKAQATLTAALEADPRQPVLWLTLAQLLSAQGRQAQAIPFFEEAVGLDPASARALDGLAEALLVGGGDVDRALAAGAEALRVASPADLPVLTDAQARRLLAAGRLEEGWRTFAERFGRGDAAAVEVRLAAPRWTPGAALNGRLLLIGEESVGEEILLAHALPSLIAEGGKPMLAIDPRWEALARRSFPEATVVRRLERPGRPRPLLTAALDGPHFHDGELVAAWAPLREMMSGYRRAPGDFAEAAPYLTADPDRVAHWREWLAALGPGRKIGVLWRAPDPARPWEAPPLPHLLAALSAPGLHLIGVQEQDLQGELVWIRDTHGVTIGEPPPELRLWDLDELAALTLALDVVVGPPDTASLLAAACGAETWLLAPPRHWAMLGAPAFPWFPKARVISAAAPDDWDDALTELAQSLAGLAERAPNG
jgi:tetratricopeptide (TPR) repeat protein